MDTTYWDQVEAVFSAVIDLNDADRHAVLNARCAGRDDVRAEVESLLSAHGRAHTFMHQPTMASGYTETTTAYEGAVVGAFRLIAPIASGGMGTVYKAERADGAFVHHAAVKIISTPISHDGAARRFRAERQILASLHHANIVTLLDGGVTATGQAYLVMEYVDGVPITQYVRDCALDVAGRLRLFRRVCDAVQYAHAHFVVHRDLKPANVLVTTDGVPKILDFGVAKLIEHPTIDPAAQVTERGIGPLTPNYASPEQLRGLPVTTATDIYALGILLYEILTGTRPYETAGRPLDDVMHLVLDTDTTRPSAAAPAAGAEPPYEWRRLLRGDLDAIALRALRKQPSERYASADALSQDIGRYLAGAPVEAREPSLVYVVRKLARRHRLAFVTAALSATMVIAALGAALWQARAATLERRRADARFNEVRQLANKLIFDVHDAVVPLPGSTPVRKTIVKEGLEYLERLTPESANNPELQIELARAYVKIGSVQGRPNTANLGDREGAIVSFQKARALLAPIATSPRASAAVVGSYIDAIRFESETLRVVGRHDESIGVARSAVDEATRFAALHPDLDEAQAMIAAAEFGLAIALGGDEALPHWQRAGAVYEQLLAKRADDPRRQRNVALVEKYLGAHYDHRRDYETGLTHHLKSLALDQQRYDRLPGDRTIQLDLAIDLSNVAYGHMARGENNEAIRVFNQSLAIRQQLLDSDPRDALARSKVAFVHRQLGLLFLRTGDTVRAAHEYRRAIEDYEASGMSLAEEKIYGGDSWAGIARLESAAAQSAKACAAWQHAFELYASASTEDRKLRMDGGEADPMVLISQRAAGCGVAAAEQWLKANPPASSNR